MDTEPVVGMARLVRLSALLRGWLDQSEYLKVYGTGYVFWADVGISVKLILYELEREDVPRCCIKDHLQHIDEHECSAVPACEVGHEA